MLATAYITFHGHEQGEKKRRHANGFSPGRDIIAAELFEFNGT